VLVLGHGISGLAMARWCLRLGARVTLADTREQPERMAQLRDLLPGVEVVAGPFDAALVERQPWALIGKSPGLSPAQLAAVQAAADERGVPVRGELALWADGLRLAYAQGGFAPQVLAITGTNGKTTTTSLTGQLLQRAGLRVAVAGNIGPALLDVLGEAMDLEEKSALALSEKAQAATENIASHVAEAGANVGADAAPAEAPASTLPQVWVLELSSFQLDGVPIGPQGFEPTAATVLNLTQDHLDWHGSMDAYAAAKQRVYGAAGLRVLNRDDAGVMAACPDAAAPSPTAKGVPAPAPVAWTSFGTDLPTRPGDWGLETVNGMTWLVRAQPADETRVTATRRRKATEPEDVVLQRLMPAEALRIRGRHNASNALAALALATAAGATLAPMLHGLREYRGEPHRVESVGVIDGVEYFDDSKGTNVGATLAAILGLGAERCLVLILGGDGKGQDFSPLADAVRRHVQAVVLIGRDAPLLREVLAPTGVPLFDAPDMPQAVRLAAAQAQEGQAVVMSPACASLDMFKHYAHRAQVFCDTVAELATEQGVTGVGA
jgi:UDP-N-acetylmuramoylalanine--D-glutamate ligase